MITPNDNPELKLQLAKLTTRSLAHPDTWNPTHQTLLNNDAALFELNRALKEAQEKAKNQQDERIGALETTSVIGTQRAVKLDWLYRRNTIQFELWQPGFTLTDNVSTDVVSAIGGDDTIVVADATGLVVGEYYVLTVPEEYSLLVKVSAILAEGHIRIETDLPRTFSGGLLTRTTFDISPVGAKAAPGDHWLSRKLQTTGNSSVIIRATLNSANIRLYWRDENHGWKESIWLARRAIDSDPGHVDYEYTVGADGSCWLRLDVEGEPVDIKHITILGENTGLGGYVNPEAKPFAPIIDSPINQSTNVPTHPTVSIKGYQSSSGVGLAGVLFEISKNNAFTDIVHHSGWISGGLSYALVDGALQYETDYYIRARVQDKALLISDWSDISYFKTEATPIPRVATPSIIAPANNALNVDPFFTIRLSLFQSQNGESGLTHSATQVQIRRAEDGWGKVLWDSGALAPTNSIDAPSRELDPDTTYALRARHQSSESGWSQWSSDSAFTTAEQFASDVTGIALVPLGTGWGAVRIDENHAQYSLPKERNYFDSHPVFGGIHDALINGQHMVRIPKFYYRRTMISLPPWQGQVDSWLISPVLKEGFELHPAFIREGVEQAEFFIGKYVCSLAQDGHLQSVPGTSPILSSIIGFKRGQNGWSNTHVNELKERLDGLNTTGSSGFDLLSLDTLSAVQMLCFIEHQTFDVRHTIAPGHTSSSIYTDVDAPINLAASYRGVTGLWGNVWQYVHGIYFSLRSSYSEYDIYKDRHLTNQPLDWLGDSSPRLFSSVSWTRAAFLYNYPKTRAADENWHLGRGYSPADNFPLNSLAGNRLIVGGQWDTADRSGMLAARGETAHDVFGFRLTKFNDQ